MNNEQIKKLENIFLPHEIDLEHHPEAIEHILSVVIDGYQHNSSYKHNVVKSSNYIHGLVCEKGKKERADHYYIRKVGMYDEIYNSSVETLFGIFSHVRNKIYKDHKRCIKEFSKKGSIICPYGLAYVHWVQYVMNYDDRWLVDRAKSYRKYTESVEFASKQDDKFLRNWLSLSEEATRERWIYKRVPFGLKNLPFFIAVVPQTRNEPLEFHWWDHPGAQQKFDFSCPFQKKNDKRVSS